MTDKELIRRALMGSREAQQECTEKGIVLPCPFCGSENIVISNWGLWRGWCQECLGKSDDQLSQADAIRKWNTRPAQPVGKCKDCINATNPGSNIVFCDYFERDMMPDDFCSCFEPREE